MKNKNSKMLTYLGNKFEEFLNSENGATAIEYGLLAAILAVGIIAGAQGIGTVVTDMWNGVSSDVTAN